MVTDAAKGRVTQTDPENISARIWNPNLWHGKVFNDQIAELFEVVMAEVQVGSAWYQAAKRRKKRASRALRAASICLAIAASLAPLLACFFRGDHDAMQAVHITETGFMFIVLAGGLVAFDRLFGLSDGWIRYMSTLTAIERVIAEFEMDWAALMQRPAVSTEPSNLEPFLERAFKTRRQLFEIVEKETSQWAAEFRNQLTSHESIVRHH